MPDVSTADLQALRAQIDRHGWASVDGVVEPELLDRVVIEIPATGDARRGGLRNLLEILDDCAVENGPIRLLPGSHRHGRLAPPDIEQWKGQTRAIECPVPRGGLLLFRPLILHASSPAAEPGHRRVVHFEFAAGDLPGGMQWHSRF